MQRVPLQINSPIRVNATIVGSASSTMDLARFYDGAKGYPHWIMARSQTQARGRQGRPWLSADGAFAASLVMQLNCPPRIAAQRSFVVACALRRALTAYVSPSLLAQKWPNDVLLNGGKVAGILLESSGAGDIVDRLTIGIGVNLGHAPKNVLDASFAPVGLADVIGQTILAEVFLEGLAEEFELLEKKFITDGFSGIRAEWTAHAARLGQVITARTSREVHIGSFEGLDDDGNLLLLTPGGKKVIPSADVFF